MTLSSPSKSKAYGGIRAPKLADRLVAKLSEQIRSGAIQTGAKLPTEHEIMHEHGVSRAVVREAISRLQAGGLVEARQGIGTFVLETAKSMNFRIDPTTVITMRDVLALLELRIGFELESAALAAVRHTPEQLRDIEGPLERFQQNLESNGETEKPDFDFHLGIAAATGNRYFVEILTHLGLAILPRARVDLRFLARDNTFQYLDRTNREHRDIYHAIARRDPEGARAAMRTHLSNSREHLNRLHQAAETAAAAGSRFL